MNIFFWLSLYRLRSLPFVSHLGDVEIAPPAALTGLSQGSAEEEEERGERREGGREGGEGQRGAGRAAEPIYPVSRVIRSAHPSGDLTRESGPGGRGEGEGGRS